MSTSSAVRLHDPKFTRFQGVVVVPKSSFGGANFLWNSQLSITLRVGLVLLLSLSLSHEGDYNLDGYPDLLVPVVRDNVQSMELWQNIPCTEETCGSAAADAEKRTFSVFTKGVDALTSISNPFAAAFFDLDENVSMLQTWLTPARASWTFWS